MVRGFAPGVEQRSIIIDKAIRGVRRHSLVDIAVRVSEQLDLFHADAMTLKAGVTLDVDRSHVPVLAADHVVGCVRAPRTEPSS